MNSQSVLELLRDSMLRRYVQYGEVVTVKSVQLPEKGKAEVVSINFMGANVYCKQEDFSSRKMKSLSGFMGTTVPFIVKEIDPVNNVVIVSRVEAIPIITRKFLSVAKEGDVVRGSVTGVWAEKNIVFAEVHGYPCIIPPGEWDLNLVTDLTEVTGIGDEIEAKIINIEEVGADEDYDFSHRIRLSRKAVLREARNQVWSNVEQFHSIGENVVAKVVAKAPGVNSWLIEIKSSGIVIIGNLQAPLNQKFKYLPQGLHVHAQIQDLNKAEQRGKARIFRIQQTIGSSSGF